MAGFAKGVARRSELSLRLPALQCPRSGGAAAVPTLRRCPPRVAAPIVAWRGRQLAKDEFEFELVFVAVGAYFAAKFSTNALE